jgi:hypothetical protein
MVKRTLYKLSIPNDPTDRDILCNILSIEESNLSSDFIEISVFGKIDNNFIGLLPAIVEGNDLDEKKVNIIYQFVTLSTRV